ncbi:MAG: EamA family transporter, partial [Desulfamplus sp.]|nr:EamA family transporter [Desulfamplus sp.]
MIVPRSKLSMLTTPPAGAFAALLAAFFYSFGAVADKMGVMTGHIIIYTFHLSAAMLIFHFIRIIGQNHTSKIVPEIRHSPLIIISGGIIMLLSFITFRLGLAEALAAYASALRQVSTLFGIIIGIFIFKEKISRERIISSLIILGGAALIKLG